MADTMKFQEERITELAKKTKECSENLKTLWDELKSKSIAVIDASWVGKPAAAYTTKVLEKENSVLAVCSALELLSNTYMKALTAIQTEENNNLAAINNTGNNPTTTENNGSGTNTETTTPPAEPATTAPPADPATTAPPAEPATTAPPAEPVTTAPPAEPATTTTPSAIDVHTDPRFQAQTVPATTQPNDPAMNYIQSGGGHGAGGGAGKMIMMEK